MAESNNPHANNQIGANFLPKFYQTPSNKKFLQATIDQLLKPGSVTKINGYIGKSNSKSSISTDLFIKSVTPTRQHYQLEPGIVVKDTSDNITLFKDYQDYINQLSIFGANVSNHARINNQEFYSWDPHIDWDKFVNFQNYYWMPYGPSTVTIYGQSSDVISELSVKIENEGDNNTYIFTPDGLTRNPILTLYRTQTYKFNIDSPDNPFSLKTARSIGTTDRYLGIGVDGNAIENGSITITIPSDAPDVLFYQSESDINLGGVIHVLSIEENTHLNVETEIIGRKFYTMTDGTPLSNGMKVQFGGKVTPQKYASGKFYVEGVGDSIILVDETSLEMISPYTTGTEVLFDSVPFDSIPFGEVTSYAGQQDYIVINRGSKDKNYWSRYNRWIHQDVINISASLNGQIASIDQSARATRPIIEFAANLKLYNFGTSNVVDVDVIDTTTTDVMSIVEGSVGFDVDSVSLTNGSRVIFTADTDPAVKDKVYKVELVDVLHETRTLTITTYTISTLRTGNLVEVDSTANMVVNQPILFSGTAVGNIVPEKVYYVGSIVDSNHITLLDKVDGNVIIQNKAIGAMTVKTVYQTTSKQIHLIEDYSPSANDVVLVRAGIKNGGLMVWYNGLSWNYTQQKLSVNQPPLFDLVDESGVSFSDRNAYVASTFGGTKIFSYKVGSGTVDTKLGFPLTYKNIANIGDIVFNFDLLTESFEYNSPTSIQKLTANGYLVKNGVSIEYVNGWKRNTLNKVQAAVRVYKDSEVSSTVGGEIVDRMYTIIDAGSTDFSDLVLTNNSFISDGTKLTGTGIVAHNDFILDIFDEIDNLSDLTVKVYVNGIWISADKVSIWDDVIYKMVRIQTPLTPTDVVTIRAFAHQPVNDKGYYEIPVNLQNNPINETLSDFTLGEVIDHVSSIVQNNDSFNGVYPGVSNLRDLGNVSNYGTKFVQHSGPLSLSLYHVTTETNNIIRAIEKSRDDYVKFKKNFISLAETLGVETDPVNMVDLILQAMNKDKPTSSPYYFSDMVPYGAKIINEYTVVDIRDTYFPLISNFSLSELSNKAVGVYLNGVQLLHHHHYSFSSQGFVVVTAELAANDVIRIQEYDSTDGCFIPETPVKLGLLPSYDPKIYLDTSYVTPRTVIQGHDGSIVLSYGDYRDDLILELEKRIYNNIKVEYDETIFNIIDIVPSYIRETAYNLTEFNEVMSPSFYKWVRLVGRDFTKKMSYEPNNSMTYNYRNYIAPDGRSVPGYWRGIYRWMLDTDRPNLCPWEMLGFNDMPHWWESVYGPAPYTCDNLVMWSDISKGFVREPGQPLVIRGKYKRPFLMDCIPVDEEGALISPLQSNLVSGMTTPFDYGDHVFGDVSPVESAWRRSSHYPFSLLITTLLLEPSKVLGVLLDRSRITRNLAGQLVYKNNGGITPSNIILPSIYSSSNRVYTAGIINYVVNYIVGDTFKSYTSYEYELHNISCKLSHRIGGYTSKEKFQLLLDSKSPQSSGSIFVPPEDYSIVLNSSNPIKKLTYSGVIVSRVEDGYEVKGYSANTPYFNYYSVFGTGNEINVGGISESYVKWEPKRTYAFGSIVSYANKFYRVKEFAPADGTTLEYIRAYTSTSQFDASHFELLRKLPVVGGRDAIVRNTFDKQTVNIAPYGTKFTSIQEVVDFLLGYGAYLTEQGFVFDEYEPASSEVSNWTTSVKQFLFWTTQNWAASQDKWQEWNQGSAVSINTIVLYNGDYYRALFNVPESDVFDYSSYELLDGLSKVGSAVISLSPAAAKLTFNTTLSMVDDISNNFNDYEIVKVDGTSIHASSLNSYRDGNSVSYTPTNTDGIYGATFYLIQKEHVVIMNNTTMFNDTIYNSASGYKQDRIKVSGYVSTNWDGSLVVPGFIIDQALVNEWQPWVSYALGDIVKYKQFYYSSLSFIPGTEVFDNTKWVKLAKKPTAAMLPNWTYKATQIDDYYNLDSDNFDVNQQRIAQHLIGYQKRQYLENIIQDDVSEFKFYKGMIVEKGTQNVLNKLFDVLSSTNKESLNFYEEWAIRVGQYGASEGYEVLEVELDETKFYNNPQGFELVVDSDDQPNDHINRYGLKEVYLAPSGYKATPWTITSKQAYLRSAGYVRPSEVKLIVASINELLTYSVNDFTVGDYVWVTFESISWNVYRYSNTYVKVKTLEQQGTFVTLTFDRTHDIKVGSCIGVHGVTELTAICSVYSVTDYGITIVGSDTTITPVDISAIAIFLFKSYRVTNNYNTDGSVSDYAVDLIDTIARNDVVPHDLVWVDDNGQGKWETLEYSPVSYIASTLSSQSPTTALGYGSSVMVSKHDTLLTISDYSGVVSVYARSVPSIPWQHLQDIPAPYIHDGTTIGLMANVMAVASDLSIIAIGSPNASYVNSLYIGEYSSKKNYVNGWHIMYNGKFYTIDTSKDVSKWSSVRYPFVVEPSRLDPTIVYPGSPGGRSSYSNQGIVSLYEITEYGKYLILDSLVSPYPADDEMFGYSIAYGDNEIFISAPGSKTVYSFVKTPVEKAKSAYDPLGSSDTVLVLASVDGVTAGMKVHSADGTTFTNSQYVMSVDVANKQVVISSAPARAPAGDISFIEYEWEYDLDRTITATNNKFGHQVIISKDFSVLAISAQASVYLYTKVDGNYTLLQTIEQTSNEMFGASISLSNTGEYILISDVHSDSPKKNTGAVYVYKFDGVEYVMYKTLTNVQPETSQYFGKKVEFVNDYQTILVYGEYSDTAISTTFDNSKTTMDKGSTTISSIKINSGRVDVYEWMYSSWIYSESLPFDNSQNLDYGHSISVGSNSMIVSAPRGKVIIENNGINYTYTSGIVYEYKKYSGSAWSVKHHEIDKPDVTKIKQAFLYDKLTNQLIKYLDVIDPLQGKIPGLANQELTYKVFYDPAVYSVDAVAGTFKVGRSYIITSVGTTDFVSIGASTNAAGVTFVATDVGFGTGTAVDIDTKVDAGLSWDKLQVGSLWWDLRTAKFVDSYDNDIVYRNSTWNTLVKGASVDVYEWVESTMLPSQWDSIADSDSGISFGISGTSLYGNSAYSVVKRYDTLGNTYTNTYYFWVKNKRIVPEIRNRNLSSYDVAKLIENPRGAGYEYMSLTGVNSFSLANVKNLLQSENVVLSIEYWTIDKTDQNIHTQWKLISMDVDTEIPSTIEQKWFDSLSGKDQMGRYVPDFSLPPKLRYGIENRPRQSMFVNRIEALKQVIEQANVVLKKSLIADSRNLTALYAEDKEPSIVKGLYDAVVDTTEELDYTGYGTFSRANVKPNIINGVIVGIQVIASGQGYVNAPYFEVVGSGEGAIIKSTIDSKGQIDGAIVINGGSGYDSNTVLVVREYSVLVHSDTASNGNWAVYTYSADAKLWSRLYTQTYNTARFWSYIDWYDSSINEFSVINHSVNALYELSNVNVLIGQLVKVRTVNSGYWVILRKFSDELTYDWSLQYEVVAAQNGTIQFSSSLYDYSNTSYGYDGAPYDGSIFDNAASAELQIIFDALKNDIFIGDMKSDYLNLFFTSVRYALSEQLYLDWIFKTSFVKVVHNVGELRQPVTYSNNNLANFEDYVAEVKPYHTQIREYVSVYDKVEDTNMMVSDFDLPPVYSHGIVPVSVKYDDGMMDLTPHVSASYPWKNWVDNVGFSVTSLLIIDQGSNYVMEPVVTITSDTGSGATARAIIANGKVVRIVLTSPGKGYLTPPDVNLSGGYISAGTSAKVVSTIGNSVIRSTLVKMKFDRISKTPYISQLDEVEVFNGNGSTRQFPLIWAPDTRTTTSTVMLKIIGAAESVEILRDTYTLTRVKSTKRGYTSYSGIITLDTAPPSGSTITVNYLKDWDMLTAADRIMYYYTPAEGELGKELSQLMTGIDYGGVNVTGLDFKVSGGWDSTPYESSRWDDYDSTNDDYTVEVIANTSSIMLPYIPEVGTEINVYYTPTETLTPTLLSGTTSTYVLYDSPPYPKVSALIHVTKLSAASISGGKVLSLADTTGINIGDIVTTANVTVSGKSVNNFSYGTTVTKVSTNAVELSDIIYFADIAANVTIDFSRNVYNKIDYTITTDGLNGMLMHLTTALVANTELIVKATRLPVRIDDLHYGTEQNVNPNSKMVTPVIPTQTTSSVIVGNGFVSIVLPTEFADTVATGDVFTLRKSTSDGSLQPSVEDYDTVISGGDLTYSSATGLAAEDIIVDGDAFVTPLNSPAPEEVMPGQVVDTLAIKVYDYPLNGSATMRVDNHIADGVQVTFTMSQELNSSQSLLVKVDDEVQETTAYTVDYVNKQITLTTAPQLKAIVTIFTMGFSGNNVLGSGRIIADGTSIKFITEARYKEPISWLVYLNGVVVPVTIFRTTNSDPLSDLIGIQFGVAPKSGDIIDYVFTNNGSRSFSVTTIEKISSPTTTNIITSFIGDRYPLETNNIVIGKTVNDGLRFLTGPNNTYYDIAKNKLRYKIDITKYQTHTLSSNDVVVYANGVKLTLTNDYAFDEKTNIVSLTRANALQYNGTRLLVSIVKDAEFFITAQTTSSNAQLQLLTSENYEYVELMSSYNNTSIDVETAVENIDYSTALTPDSVEYFNYKDISGGNITLPRAVISESYVWVTVNGWLLTPNVDYVLSDNKLKVILTTPPPDNSSILIITYGSNIMQPIVSYMQFKDMLNRTHYKRLNGQKRTKLTRDLLVNDLVIQVEDASNFDIPEPTRNIPGIIEIRGERIEYFTINGNELGQLRRGTLGTGTPVVHVSGTYVQDIGITETIPYNDKVITQRIMSDGTNVIPVDFIPTKSTVDRTYVNGFVSSIPSGYGTSDTIEVFVGGYNDTTIWQVGVVYNVGDIVTVSSNTYQCTRLHTSTKFKSDYGYWKLFIGNIRLKKTPYKLHDVNLHPDSTDGDIQMDAEFSVDGKLPQIWLTTSLPYGTYVTVVYKSGIEWDGDSSILTNGSSYANFITAVPGINYSAMK